jgi:hypothetical protein
MAETILISAAIAEAQLPAKNTAAMTQPITNRCCPNYSSARALLKTSQTARKTSFPLTHFSR